MPLPRRPQALYSAVDDALRSCPLQRTPSIAESRPWGGIERLWSWWFISGYVICAVPERRPRLYRGSGSQPGLTALGEQRQEINDFACAIDFKAQLERDSAHKILRETAIHALSTP